MLLPIGISFYTFMAISYVVDVSRYEIVPSGWLDVSVYLAFFPHLVAGPIVRGNELIPQIRRRRDPKGIDLSRAAFLISGGLFKKVVVSGYLATQIVDPVFGAPSAHGGLEVLIAIYAYAIVIYADFSAYTDIAIGTALLLGFEFPQNFDRPYTATSLRDFWRRWHMTLSRWLRDYLYIPLGGSRHGEAAHRREHHDHDAARRPVARRRVDVRRVGHLLRRGPRDRPLARAPRTRGRRPWPPRPDGSSLASAW